MSDSTYAPKNSHKARSDTDKLAGVLEALVEYIEQSTRGIPSGPNVLSAKNRVLARIESLRD